MMWKVTVLAVFLAGPASAQQSAPTTPPAGARQQHVIEQVQQVVPVSLQQPIAFWRAGKREETRDAFVLKIKVSNPLDFLPRDSQPPHFLYGDAVCEEIKSPILDGVAILLAPKPPSGQTPTLTIAPGVSPEKLDGRYLRLTQSTRARQEVRVELPPITVQVKNYKSREELKREFAPALQGKKP